jgi:hypothetical protein
MCRIIRTWTPKLIEVPIRGLLQILNKGNVSVTRGIFLIYLGCGQPEF